MKQILRSLLICGLAVGIAISAPRIHYSYIRSKVGSQVVKLTGYPPKGGGTGFHLQAPSGKTYIVTNAHMCDYLNKDGVLYAENEQGRLIPRRIIESSPETDLCIVEGLEGYSGLKIANGYSYRTEYSAIGFPRLFPQTISSGEFTAPMDVEVLDHIMDFRDENDKCDLPKNRIAEIETFFGKMTACLIKVQANMTNIVIHGGNSGSPVVNKFGNVVGVVFAGNSATNYGLVIKLEELKKFVSVY